MVSDIIRSFYLKAFACLPILSLRGKEMKIATKYKTEVIIQHYRSQIVRRFCYCSVCEQRLQFEYFNPSAHQIAEFPYCISCGVRFKTHAHSLH